MEEINPQPKKESDAKVLRTYTSDMAEAIRTNEMSVIKIALAEKEKREQEAIEMKAEGSNITKILFLIGGIILIISAFIGSYILIEKKKENIATETKNKSVETFISYDSKLDINIDEKTTTKTLLDEIKKEPKGTELVKAIFLTKKDGEETKMITSNEFLSLIKGTAPGGLTRSLSDKYLLGKYSNPNAINESGKSATFLIFQTTEYNQAYASMLEWEKTMLKDMETLFEIKITQEDNMIYNKQWEDIVVNNKDARVLRTTKGEGILYYVFVNKNNFIITNNAESLKEIITRVLVKNN